CLLYGVTSAHILAVEVVLPDGEVAVLGGLDPEPDGLDLRGAFVGSEGTMGIATRIAVRLTPLPPAVATVLADFTDMADAAAAVTGIIASGIPTDGAAVLLIEMDGLPGGVAAQTRQVQEILAGHQARGVRVAANPAERGLWWKARKSAFGA